MSFEVFEVFIGSITTCLELVFGDYLPENVVVPDNRPVLHLLQFDLCPR